MTTLAAALFDLDGTLVDSNEFHVRSWHQAFADSGHEFAADIIRQQIGKGADQLLPSLLPGASEEEGAGKRIAQRHDELFRDLYRSHVRPFPDAADLIRDLHAAGVKVVLASSSSRKDVDHYARLLGVDEILTARTSSDDVERTKPAGDIFAAALACIPSVHPHEAVVIGDTPYDVIAANRCGLASIAVLTGGFDERWLREAGASAVYRDMTALRARFREAGHLLPD